jgi:hypothetical protein
VLSYAKKLKKCINVKAIVAGPKFITTRDRNPGTTTIIIIFYL